MRRFVPGAASPWRLVLDVAAAGAWLGTAAMLAFAIARMARPDTNLVLIWANAYTFWIYLPAYGIAAFGLLARKHFLMGASAAVVALHLAWVLPDYRPAEDIPAEAETAPRLRLMTMNVFFGNEDFSAVAAEVVELDADVVFLQEYGPDLARSLSRTGIEERYPYREIAYENRFYGLAIFSKLPLRDAEQIVAGGRPFIRAVVDVDGMPVTLYHVHPTSPGLGLGFANNWNDAWSDISRDVAAEEGAVVVAGDFNMNQHHKWYRELKADGLDNCHEERGRGNATTWPQLRRLPDVRIDHVFHSEQIVCMSVREGRGEGSDHKPVIAELAILP